MEMQIVKLVLMTFQIGTKTLLGIGLEVILRYILEKNLFTFCLHPKTAGG
jgi:hypothetical protein